ncbi:hypothetical protein PC111_g5381 [Phytophthora cactorum]|nr:hypothetical protein PC111_g5381 [Phytophthora cactorum]
MGRISSEVFTSEGGIAILIELLRDGNTEQKWSAASTMERLAINPVNRAEIGSQGGISPLMGLLNSGDEGLNQVAAGAVRNLAFDNTDNCVEIDKQGGIPLILALLRGVIELLTSHLRSDTEIQKNSAAYGLMCFAKASADIRAKLARGEAVKLLDELERNGTGLSQESAATALMSILRNGKIRAELERKRSAPPLLQRLRFETGEQLESTAQELVSLANSNPAICADVIKDGIISHIIQKLRFGTDEMKQSSALVLAKLLSNTTIRTEIVRQEGVAVLEALKYTGTDRQKELAERALQAALQQNEDGCMVMWRNCIHWTKHILPGRK